MIAEAALDIRELEAEVAAENRRRYAFLRMLHATDRILWRLEEMNRDGVQELREDVRARMRASLAELPAEVREWFAEEGSVQIALDSVFEVQNRLLNLHIPGRAALLDNDEDADTGPPGLRDRILERLRANPGGLTSNDLARNTQPWDKDVRRMLPTLVAEGIVRFDDGPRHATGPGRRRYFAVGEGGRG